MGKILKEVERLYCKITDYLFLTENFHKYQIKYSKIYSNSYILKENQYSFVHPPKSAGTAISTFLYENNINIFVSAHNLVSKNCDPSKFKYIIVIRNPINRVKSFYEMQLRNRRLAFHNHAKKGLSYFVKRVNINQNCLCKFLIGDLDSHIDEEKFEIAKKNLRNFFFIMDFENLDKDINALKIKFNIKNDLKNIEKKIKKKRIYSNDENRIIIDNNKYDIKLWNYYQTNIKNLNR